MSKKLNILGIGGTSSPCSTTEKALNIALNKAEKLGAKVERVHSDLLMALPHYAYGVLDNCEAARSFVEKVRNADGIILASPCYHGSVSGLIKNALDYVEETAKDARVYLDGVPVGLIVNAYGWQAIGPTLSTMRSITHALRGWPTPFGAGIKVTPGMFEGEQVTDAEVKAQLELVGAQVVEFSSRQLLAKAS